MQARRRTSRRPLQIRSGRTRVRKATLGARLAPVRPRLLHDSAQSNLDPSVEPGSHPDVRPEEEPGSLLALALLALVGGGAAGLICAGFRLAPEEADRLRDRVIALAHDGGFAGFLLLVGGAGLTVAAAALAGTRVLAFRFGGGLPPLAEGP